MGMFDSLYVECPNEDCDGTIEFQSKAGDCSLHSYSLTNCPAGVAGDLIGETERCQKCGRSVTLRGHVFLFID